MEIIVTEEVDFGIEILSKTQPDINNFFSGFPQEDHHPQFREFSEKNTTEMSKLLLELSGTDGVESAIAYAKKVITENHLNPILVKIALAIYLTHSPEAQKRGLVVPPLKHHSEFRTTKKVPLSNPVSPDTLNGYNILSYFREDYEFNDHHYHWHIVYPYAGIVRDDGKITRTIERQGELFLYMHSQMIARYNAELLSWDLNLLHAWGYDDILTFGYTPVPGMRDQFGARPPFQGWYEDHSPHLPENERDDFPPRNTMIEWKNNVIQSINQGFFVTKKKDGSRGKLQLTPEIACNWVGIVVEAENHPLQEVEPGSGEYIDGKLYGSIHNLGHDKFAEIGYHEYTSDTNQMGMMISNIGSPRDPCFWLWHRHIDDFRQMVVQKYSHNLNEFKPDNLKILDLKISPKNPGSTTPQGGIATFLEPPDLELNEANAKLNHEPYKWEITVESTSLNPPEPTNPQYFTVRLFIAPAELIQDQRSWIEMDKFTHGITSAQETLTRKDVESSVARRVKLDVKPGEQPSSWCLCGWPQSMMLPIGKPGGAPYVAFAMLTDDQLSHDKTQSISFCGVKDQKYPDPRGMGYPFNKTWDVRINSTVPVREIIKNHPHTKISDFTIYRSTELYQGATGGDKPPTGVTWQNTIKGFFTEHEVQCMLWKFNLADKNSVQLHAGEIYAAVKSHTMPKGETPWSDEKVATFNTWMESDFP